MITRWLIRCLKHKPGGCCDFLLEWHETTESMVDAVAEHKERGWDSIDCGKIEGPGAPQAVAVGGWNMPTRQRELSQGELR